MGVDSDVQKKLLRSSAGACLWVCNVVRHPEESLPYHVEALGFKKTVKPKCLNEALYRVKESVLVTFHLRKVFCPMFWYLCSKEEENWRDAGNATIQPSHVMATTTQPPPPTIVHSIHRPLLHCATEVIHLTQSKNKPPASRNAVFTTNTHVNSAKIQGTGQNVQTALEQNTPQC